MHTSAFKTFAGLFALILVIELPYAILLQVAFVPRAAIRIKL